MKFYNTHNVYSLNTLTALIISLFLFTACNNPAGSDDHDEHEDPFGVALIMNGVEIAKQENGVVSYHEGDHLELEVGEETSLITVRFIAEDGDRFEPDVNDGYSLQWEIDNENILEVEQHESDGPWSFHLVGHSAGETTFKIILWHDDGDHDDFTSLNFEVHVEEVVSSMEIQNEAGETLITTDGSEASGNFSVNAGETSGEYTAYFFDEDGEPVELSSEYELEWDLEGSEYATLNASDESPYSFTVTGLQAGEAEVHFSLVRHEDEDDDHNHESEVFASPDIIITVN